AKRGEYSLVERELALDAAKPCVAPDGSEHFLFTDAEREELNARAREIGVPKAEARRLREERKRQRAAEERVAKRVMSEDDGATFAAYVAEAREHLEKVRKAEEKGAEPPELRAGKPRR